MLDTLMPWVWFVMTLVGYWCLASAVFLAGWCLLISGAKRMGED